MILSHVDKTKAAGARQIAICDLLEIDERTIQRWRSEGGGEDRRRGPNTVPGNKLSIQERDKVLKTVNSFEFRDLSPKQIVPTLASRGEYLASESTIYRVLREEKQLKHREPSRPKTKRHKPDEFVATGPNEVWSWDITYLKSSLRGTFFYLYMAVDVWSRKVVAWEIYDEESSENAAKLLTDAYRREGVAPGSLVIHMDNGSPMKGATLLLTLQDLGVATSFSRPSVSNDNAYSESIFGTMKYRPGFPSKPFGSIAAARVWVAAFVAWYNSVHLHSGVRFVTPEDRHSGRELEILKLRQETYEKARARHPERWTGKVRNWNPIKEVFLNPDQEQVSKAG
jgi:putative transposase